MFVPGKSFYPSLMFVDKAGSLPKSEAFVNYRLKSLITWAPWMKVWLIKDNYIWSWLHSFMEQLLYSLVFHVRYLSHLALQVGFSNGVHKTRIHSIQRWHDFGVKTSWSAFLLEKRLYPLLYWIRYSWSRSTHILYYINLSVRWNTLLRKQISSCQQVFYCRCWFNCRQQRISIFFQIWAKINF